jgi:hypothetical protein
MNIMKNSVAVALLCGLLAGSAYADPTYTFSWDPGETSFFRFANGTSIPQSAVPDSWEGTINGAGALTGFGPGAPKLHNTPLLVSGSVVKMRFTVEGVTGSVNLVAETAVWTITGHVSFTNGGAVLEPSCTTSSFTVSFSGGYNSGTDSSLFKVPALNGAGTQACGGAAATINSTFSNGTTNSKLHFNKFTITP